jgi:hypothetical protein
LDGRHTLLDVVCACLRELIMDSQLSISTSTLRLLGVCLVVGMPRSGEDLCCMLHQAESYRHPDFLYQDILSFRSLWLSCFCREGTVADMCSMISVLPDPLFSTKTRAFLRVLLCVLDAEDISFIRNIGYVDDWVWDQLPPKQLEPLRAVSGTVSDASNAVSAKKRIGSRPGWKRRVSISLPMTVGFNGFLVPMVHLFLNSISRGSCYMWASTIPLNHGTSQFHSTRGQGTDPNHCHGRGHMKTGFVPSRLLIGMEGLVARYWMRRNGSRE